MRLIDVDATIPMIKYATTDNEIGVFPIKIGFDDIVKVLNAQPTVDAIPVEWIKQFIKKDNIDIISKVGIVNMVEQWKLYPIDFEISSEDAIPVRWLKENFPTNGVYGTESYFRKAHAVQEVLELWETEKEKRKEE